MDQNSVPPSPPPANPRVLVWIVAALALVIAAFIASSLYTVSNLLGEVSGRVRSGSFFDDGNIGVLKIEGVILDSAETLEDLEMFLEDDAIKAIVVRIQSPGGAVGPSQEIFQALMEARKKKPLACSLGDIAASGGYYIAAACERIFSNAGTLTGSIGVIMHLMNLKDLYAWAKIEPITIKSGRFKDIGNESRPMLPEEKQLLDELLAETHLQFKKDIAEGRSRSVESLEPFADGRILTGTQALAAALVDEIGGEQRAIAWAAEKAKIKGKAQPVRPSKRGSKWESFLDSVSQHKPMEAFLRKSIPSLQLSPGVPYYLPAQLYSQGRP
jgi:protease-4